MARIVIVTQNLLDYYSEQLNWRKQQLLVMFVQVTMLAPPNRDGSLTAVAILPREGTSPSWASVESPNDVEVTQHSADCLQILLEWVILLRRNWLIPHFVAVYWSPSQSDSKPLYHRVLCEKKYKCRHIYSFSNRYLYPYAKGCARWSSLLLVCDHFT
jgi:hypothetical protein